MPRIVTLVGVVDDGTAFTGLVQPDRGQAVESAFGENLTIHLILVNPSGRQILSSTQRVITYGARTKPLPDGQLLFQHLGVISSLLDGGWDCAIVPNDYRLIGNGAGRFPFDIWITDNTLIEPQSCPVQPLAAWIVKPSAIAVTGPNTSPVPQSIVAYGLPTPIPDRVLSTNPDGTLAWLTGGSGATIPTYASIPALPAAGLNDKTFAVTTLEKALVFSMFNGWVVLATVP